MRLQLSAILLFIFILMFQFFNKYGTVDIICYQFNKAYITAEFCENKEKPQLKCNGKCHLKKVIQEKKEKESDPQQNFETEEDRINLYQNQESKIAKANSYIVNYDLTFLGEESTYYYNNSYTHLHTSGVFHPPKA